MPFTPTDPPLLQDENANELGKWMKAELERLAASFESPDVTAYKVLHVEPPKPREGQIVVADGSDWDPGSGAGQYMYIGGQWVFQRSGPEPNSYGVITDGTTAAPANGGGATFKLRGEGITPVTQNDDGTHGDNANLRLTPTTLTLAAPAIGDAIPFGDISDSNNPKKMTPQTLFDLIAALTSKAAPDGDDLWMIYDSAASAAKKATPATATRKLISSTNLSGATVDITVPSGFNDILLEIQALSMAANALAQIDFSEDAGASLVSQTWRIFTEALQSGGTATTGGSLSPGATTSGAGMGVQELISNYGSSNFKFVRHGSACTVTTPATVGAVGFRQINSTAAINLIRLTAPATTFDAGVARLWGLM